VFYEKSGFFYYKKLKQHVFIDGQLINKQLSEKDYVIKEQPLRMAIIDSKEYLIK
jgi:hypothetical protein